MLQLQYISQSCGLRRSYLESDGPKELAKPLNINEPIIPDGTKSPENTTAAVAPDIEWHPSHHTYQNRIDRLAAYGDNRPMTLPDGFPEVIHSPRVWTGLDFGDKESFIVQLTEMDILEIEGGLNHFKGMYPTESHASPD